MEEVNHSLVITVLVLVGHLRRKFKDYFFCFKSWPNDMFSDFRERCFSPPSMFHYLSPSLPLSKNNKIFYLFFKDFMFLFLERAEGKEKEREKHQCVVASCLPPTGDLACNPGMCPDWELNQWLFGSWAGTQSTEPHQPGPNTYF